MPSKKVLNLVKALSDGDIDDEFHGRASGGNATEVVPGGTGRDQSGESGPRMAPRLDRFATRSVKYW